MHFHATVCALFLCGYALLDATVHGFIASYNKRSRPSALEASCDRRSFWDATLTTAAAVLLISQPAFADGDSVDDLSMPSEDEIKKAEADAAAERLRIKSEWQKKSSRPLSFAENLAQEKEKQRQLQKTKEERRNALCEELGRGC
ncbi:hypothetical protein IV203_007784 [Nitzschia inconspicua]|uniref:Uncharacterized protein n=1 Tax=Nitzschia inconspicua TaxID=303405 RepID=A0A9K3KZ00_9STRA|nr:hypothetical protein IV203_007784 [Nitzschia inconspicua]